MAGNPSGLQNFNSGRQVNTHDVSRTLTLADVVISIRLWDIPIRGVPLDRQ